MLFGVAAGMWANPCVSWGVLPGEAEVVEVTHVLGLPSLIPSGLQWRGHHVSLPRC